MNINDILSFLKSIGEICSYHGDSQLSISGFCSLKNIKPHSIVWIRDTSKFDLRSLDASLELLIVADTAQDEYIDGYNVIICRKPRNVYFSILAHFFAKPIKPAIAPTAVIETDKIGEHVSIGHHCYIGREVTIGNNVIIRNNVTIEGKVSIGDNSIINSGVVIGTDGFGYIRTEDGTSVKVPHFGGVQIGKDVEIGGNTCVERGTLDDTIIEDNVKIDNLCLIGHNAHIKEKVLIIGLSIICGSCVIGRRCHIAPSATVMNNITIGDNTVVGIGATVKHDVAPNKVVVANSVRTIRENIGKNRGID